MKRRHPHPCPDVPQGIRRPAIFALVWLLGALACLPLPAAGLAQEGPDQDVAISTGDDGPDMAMAMEKARRSLPEFWHEFDRPGPEVDGFAVKIGVADEFGEEFVWICDLQRAGATVTGRVDNAPQSVTAVRQGENYSFHQDRIVDWMFFRRGKIVGNETMRPLLAYMPDDQAAYFRSLLEKP